jgi:carbamoyltransferase
MGHDASVCVVDDGRIVSLIERERHTRIKHAGISEVGDIDRALADAGCSLSDIDVVSITATQNWPFIFYDKDEFFFDYDPEFAETVRSPRDVQPRFANIAKGLHEKQEVTRHRIDRTFQDPATAFGQMLARPIEYDSPSLDFRMNREFPLHPSYWDDNRSLKDIRDMNPETVRDLLKATGPLRIYHTPLKVTIRGLSFPGVQIPHHIAHAATAYYQSDRDNAMIATYDGGVRKEVFGHAGGLFCVARDNAIAPLMPNFLTSANMYDRVGKFLRLDEGPGAPGKLMGLAPYGKPRFFTERMVGNLYDAPEVMAMEENFLFKHALHLIRRAHTVGHAAGYENLTPTQETKLSPFSRDLAASCQRVFEEQLLAAAFTLQHIAVSSQSSFDTLCLSGGGALNCPANARLWRDGPFENVFVPPTCDDSGLSIGSALYTLHTLFDRPRQPQGATTSTSAYLGERHSPESIEAAIAARRDRLKITPVGGSAPADAAEALAGDNVVAWYEGRSEIGPRALGHRSILADPRQGANWKRVNGIKKREEWRPFAPAVLEEKAAHWFDGCQTPSPFMLYTARVASRELPAITHVDGSARIQTVARDCGGFRELLEAFDKETGVPVVMNTSFNGPGEPIVETADDALNFFETSDLDRLYIGGYRIEHPGED